MAVYQWSTTALTNQASDNNINLKEGQAPSLLNDASRGMMAEIAKYRDDTAGITTTGGPVDYVVATGQVFTSFALMDRASIVIIPNIANSTTAPTLNVDTLGQKPLRFASGTNPGVGSFLAGTAYQINYFNSTNEFVVQNIPLVIASGALAANTVAAVQIVNGSVGSTELAPNAVQTVNIADANVTTAKILDGNVTLGKLTTDATNKGKVIGYDYTTGAATSLQQGGALLHVREQQLSGVNGGGTFTANSYTQRVLNQTVTNELGAPVSGNQITLPAGTYFCTGYVTSHMSSTSNSLATMRAKLFNVTGGANLILGSSEYAIANISADLNVSSKLNGRFTLGVLSVIELRAWHVGGGAAQATGSGDIEVYTDLLIWILST